MAKVRVKLLRPLNGAEFGSEAEYDEADAKRLAGYGAVKILGAATAKKAEAPDKENKMEQTLTNKSAAGTKATKAPARKAK